MNLPTQLTVARAVLALVVPVLLAWPGWLGPSLAILVFLIASFTDWLDGFLARRWHQTSPLGALLDPLADKLLVLGVLGVFAWRALVPWWVVGVIVAREALVTAARAWAANRRVVLAAAQEGKHKMVWQLFTIACLMAVMLLDGLSGGAAQLATLRTWVFRVGVCALVVSVALTVVSGVTFFWRHRRVWRGAHG